MNVLFVLHCLLVASQNRTVFVYLFYRAKTLNSVVCAHDRFVADFVAKNFRHMRKLIAAYDDFTVCANILRIDKKSSDFHILINSIEIMPF